MARQPHVEIEPPKGSPDILELTVGDVTIKRGQLVSWESNTCIVMDTVTDDATFPGFAINQKNAGYIEPDRLVVAMVGVLSIDCTSAAYEAMAGLKWASEDTLVADGSANTLAWAWRKSRGTVTRMQAYFNVPVLGKLFAVSA